MMITTTFTKNEFTALTAVLANAVAAIEWDDPESYHGGMGNDRCEFCTALMKLLNSPQIPSVIGRRESAFSRSRFTLDGGSQEFDWPAAFKILTRMGLPAKEMLDDAMAVWDAEHPVR